MANINKLKRDFEVTKRNNAFELKAEIQRCKDELQSFTPGTKEYAEVLKAYETLLTQEKELKRIKEDCSKVLWGAAFTIGGWIVYRKLIDTSADPFFKEIGKNFIKIVRL